MFEKIIYKKKSAKADSNFASAIQIIVKAELGELEKTNYYCQKCFTKKPEIYYTCSECGRLLCHEHIREHRITMEWKCVDCLGIKDKEITKSY